MNPIKMHVTLEIETSGETEAEELGWMLNLLRFEMSQWSTNWKGKVRRVQFTPRVAACRAVSPQEMEGQLPLPLVSAQG